jgi:hypothetical protein
MRPGRKPPRQLSEFRSAVEEQIREAFARGEFDGLSGAGRPLPRRDTSDPAWWAKKKLQEEGLQPALPPALELRRDVEHAFERLPRLTSERLVRELFGGLSARIRKVNATSLGGPSTGLLPLDVEAIVKRWRELRRANG